MKISPQSSASPTGGRRADLTKATKVIHGRCDEHRHMHGLCLQHRRGGRLPWANDIGRQCFAKARNAWFGASNHLAKTYQAKSIDAEKAKVSISNRQHWTEWLTKAISITSRMNSITNLDMRAKANSNHTKVARYLGRRRLWLGALLYILGPNPMDLVDRAHAIIDAMNTSDNDATYSLYPSPLGCCTLERMPRHIESHQRR